LSAAGFTNVTITADKARFTYADEEVWWQSLWSHGMRGWLETLEQQQGAAVVQRFKEAAFTHFTHLQGHRAPDGFPQTSSVLFGIATRPLS
jgi:hypothetical protein